MNLKVNEIFYDQSGGKTYRVLEQQGQQHGAVYSVEELQTKQKFSLKIQTSITPKEQSLLKVFVEKKFTNVVNTISFGEYQNKYHYQIMEYCKISLYDTIMEQGTITSEQFRYVAHQIAKGLKELHDLGVIHRDIKPENIMQFDHQDQGTKKIQQTYKICDFYFVTQQDIAKTQLKGTPYYLAPEQLNSVPTHYTNKVDIWALGAVFYELVTGQPLFQAHTQEQTYELIRNAQILDRIEKLTLKPEYIRLIKDMLNRVPSDRLSIEQVLNALQANIKVQKYPRINSDRPVQEQNFQITQRNIFSQQYQNNGLQHHSHTEGSSNQQTRINIIPSQPRIIQQPNIQQQIQLSTQASRQQMIAQNLNIQENFNNQNRPQMRLNQSLQFKVNPGK